MAFAAFGSGSGQEHKSPTKSSKIVLALLMPGLVYLGLFFLTPLISLVVTSLEVPAAGMGIGQYEYGFQWQNYVDVITSNYPQIFRSFFYAAVATIVALLFSYPLAYFIGVKLRTRPLIQRLMLVLVIAPFFISFLLRTIAWKQIFSDGGALMQFAYHTGIMNKSQHFLGTDAAVIFGLTYNFIPFMTLPLFSTLERFDVRLLEAGSDLYASPAKVFRKITLPITMPGIISGTLLVFIPIAGDYVNASQNFLGSSKTSMIGTIVDFEVLQTQTYPIASALSVLLMAVIVALVSLYVRSSGTEDLL
jgi:spermidine/putrescine transport system permease protein